MLEALSKFVDELKASGWRAAMAALAAGLFLYLSKLGHLPPLDPPWVELVVSAVMFVFGALASASLGSAIQGGIQFAWSTWKAKRALTKVRQAFIADIPYLTEKERQILGYLREKRQKRFMA